MEPKWNNRDGMASEVEMGEFLFGLVRFVKPALIVETGTYKGDSTIYLMKGVLENQYGRIITCDTKQQVIPPCTPSTVLEYRIISSLELPELAEADLVFSDSGDWPVRQAEYDRVKRGCVFVVHDVISPEKKEDQISRRDWVHAQGGIVMHFSRGFGIIIKS